MTHNPKSIRPFLGSKDFQVSRSFYQDLGFSESVIDNHFSYFYSGAFGFYLQDAYVKDWIDNTMVFMEVDDVDRYYSELQKLDLGQRYGNVRLVPVRNENWGRECFLHDPSGILWHFGEFYPKNDSKKV